MKTKNNTPIKVDTKFSPIHFRERKENNLVVGNDYFISFGMNKAIPCILLYIINNGKEIGKQVRIGIRNNSPLGYGDIHVVYSDEIGNTPEEAVMNEQTF